MTERETLNILGNLIREDLNWTYYSDQGTANLIAEAMTIATGFKYAAKSGKDGKIWITKAETL